MSLLSPYQSRVVEVHRRLQRLFRCVLWMLEKGHRDPTAEFLGLILKELQFHHGLEELRLHPVLSRLQPSRASLVARLESDHRHLEEEVQRLGNLLALGTDLALVQKRAERLQEFLVDHLSLEQQQAFLPLETLAVMNADAVAPGT